MNQPAIVPILVYHKCPDDFEEHLAYIKRRRLIPSHFPEICDYIETQDQDKFPKCKIVITFDDAYRDFKENVLQKLEGASNGIFQFKTTVCVPVGCISNRNGDCQDLSSQDLMTWAELRELSMHPLLQFIPHSVSHARFDQFDGRQNKGALLEYEIGKSKRILIDQLNLPQEPLFFCLPGGAGWKTGKETDPQDRLVIDVLKQFGYKGALRAEYKMSEDWNRFCIPRCEPSSVDRLKELLEREFSCKD